MLSRSLGAAILACAFAATLSGPASALPLVDLDAPEANIIQVYGGCGPFGHRGPYGGCRTGGQAGGYVRGRFCPRGFHIGPAGRRCRPNRF